MAISQSQTSNFPSLRDLLSNIDQKIDSVGYDSRKVTKSDSAGVGNTEQYLRFLLNNTVMAIPLANIISVVRHPQITPLPNTKEWVLGISNINGEIVSVIDLNSFFELPTKDEVATKSLIVLNNRVYKTSLSVDKIIDISSINFTKLTNPKDPLSLDGKADKLTPFIKNVEHNSNIKTHYLDIEKLMSSQRMTIL